MDMPERQLTNWQLIAFLFVLAFAMFSFPRLCDYVDAPTKDYTLKNAINSIVLITAETSIVGSDKSVFGSGVVVYKAEDRIYILTVAHMFNDDDLFIYQFLNNFNIRELWDVLVSDIYFSYNGDVLATTTAKAEIVNIDFDKDLALLECFFDSKDLLSARIATVVPEVLDDLWIVGHPDGKYRTVTKGIVSSKKRKVDNRVMWQSDAGAFAGSSGGAVFDENGMLVGVVSSIAAFGDIPLTFIVHFVPPHIIKDFINSTELNKFRIY